jgi:glyoxylase-like metal-dependent hydrolase (beta-lactamase superfamily II)
MHQLRGAIIPVTPFQQNCTILWDDTSKRGFVVDPGGEAERILAAIDRLGLSIERILLTHGHMDHAGGAAELAEVLRARAPDVTLPLEGPDRRDRFLLDELESQAARYGITARNVVPDRWLQEGDAITLGMHRFDVLHCPGHTPGHIVYINRAAGLGILGDVLFQGSVGRTDFPYGDHVALIDAITSKLLPLGDDFQFLCGHGPGSTIGAERRHNPFLR